MPELTPASTALTADDQRDALAAPVRDPLWMLARQWQTGGFLADDAGTPVHVRMSHVTAPLANDTGVLTGPMQPFIEAEPLPALDALDHSELVVLAAELRRRLRDEEAEEALGALATAFGFDPPEPGASVRPFAGRVPDVRKLHAALAPAMGLDGAAGVLPAVPGLDGQLAAAVGRACRGWLEWLSPRTAPAAGGAGVTSPPGWDDERLEYRVRLSSLVPAGSVGLVADDYDGSGLDWYALDRTPLVPGPGAAAGETVEVRPTAVGYPGMPRPRFWEIEDGDVNLDALRTDADPAHAVLVSFVHQYANDWYVIPLRVAPGVTTVTAFTVTDTFGTTTDVPAVAAVDGGRGPWRLWELTCTAAAGDAATGMRLLMAPAAAPLEGEALEDVLLVRDEMANLAWVVERVTRDRDGEGVDRYQRYLRLRPPADPSFDPAGRGQAATYRIGTPLPDNWYPLVAATGPDMRAILALAQLPPEASSVSDDGVQGTLIRHTPETVIADEEVPREGAHITRHDRLTVGPDGIVTWRARAKTTGLGEASSGLRFDILE